jgi:predicted dehydrogenase
MIRIGIVGCGRILNAHLRGFQVMRAQGLGDFRITAFAARPGKIDDARPFCRRGWAEPRRSVTGEDDPLGVEYTPVSDFQDDVEAKPYDDYRRMLDDDVCDAVLDTTSLFAHHEVVCDALEAGKHVLVQKPIAISVKAARRMCDLADAKGLTLGLVETARYDESTRAQAWAFHSGLLGAPQMAFFGAIGGRWAPDRITAETPWRHHKLEAGGGGSIDIGVHLFHHLRYIFGEVIDVTAVAGTFEKVRCNRDAAGRIVEQTDVNVDDTFVAVSNYESGAQGTIVWSWAGHGEPGGFDAGKMFYGSTGSIKDDRLRLDDGTAGSLRERFLADAGRDMLERFFPAGVRDPFALNQYDWLRALTDPARPPETDGRQGLCDLAASYAILESSVARRTVTLDEVLTGRVNAYQREIDAHYGL